MSIKSARASSSLPCACLCSSGTAPCAEHLPVTQGCMRARLSAKSARAAEDQSEVLQDSKLTTNK
jgi:hypothetical protein